MSARIFRLSLCAMIAFFGFASPGPRVVNGAAREPRSAAQARYKIDAARSKFIVRAFVGGLFSAFGHDHTIAIRDFTGEAQFTFNTVEPASLQFTIKADSLSVIDKVSEKDRQEIESTMRQQVLETSRYPQIVFKSTGITASRTGEGQYQLKIKGDLTLHSVTRNISIDAQVSFGSDSLRARGQFSLRQTDYKITPVSVAAGTIKVKDELKLSFDIVAHQ